MTLPAACASDPARSRGRLHPEIETERGPRDAFQRDRDRVVHSISFRRLRHKTQVFMAPDGDHFRVRLTHSIEVAQIGRAIARALGLPKRERDSLAFEIRRLLAAGVAVALASDCNPGTCYSSSMPLAISCSPRM